MPRFALMVSASVLALAGAGLAHGGEVWEHVTNADGIAVTARDVPGRGFPTFRAVGTIDANLYDVLGVLSDVGRHKEWMQRCAEARLLRKMGETEYIVYSRTDAPWPVADRDAVFHSKVYWDTNKHVIDVRFWAERSPLMGEVKGVVRMYNLRGHYKFIGLGPSRTYVDYQVDADPGGKLPRWIAKLATRTLPLDTIRALRRQAQRTRGWYTERIKGWQALEKRQPARMR
jgi:hypothetical protein